MQRKEIKAETRKLMGKKVRFLRREGIVPVHLFGHGQESLALQSNTTELERTLSQVGMTRLLNLKIKDEKEAKPVLVREIQRGATGKLLHVDFYQVKMGEAVEVEVPIVLVGDAPALKSKDNMLMQELDKLNIESLPDKIPANIPVDVSTLAEPDQEIRVKDIHVPSGIKILDEPDRLIVKVVVRPEEKAAPEKPAPVPTAELPTVKEKAEESKEKEK